jgi:hypothetical protein
MVGVIAEWALNKLTTYNLRHHHIVSVPERRIARLSVYLLNISNSRMMAEYRVRIGKFRVYVKVLSLHINAILAGRSRGEGSFGVILQNRVGMQEFMTKIQTKTITQEEIEDVVREVAISKLCSELEVGPAIETSIGFDVVIYTDAVQFHLEKCKPLSKQLL